MDQDNLNIAALADRLLADDGTLLSDLAGELANRGHLFAYVGTVTALNADPDHPPSGHAGQEQEGSQILVTIPPPLLETIELYAMHMGVTCGGAIRDLLNRGLDSIEMPL